MLNNEDGMIVLYFKPYERYLLQVVTSREVCEIVSKYK